MIPDARLVELIEANASPFSYERDIAECLRELQQLRAAKEQGREWRPIESAPGDHRMFLVHAPTSQRGRVDYAFKEFTTGKIMVQTMMGWEDIEHFGSPATHWMPLPLPPPFQGAK